VSAGRKRAHLRDEHIGVFTWHDGHGQAQPFRERRA
jgi:hypothetical protein